MPLSRLGLVAGLACVLTVACDSPSAVDSDAGADSGPRQDAGPMPGDLAVIAAIGSTTEGIAASVDPSVSPSVYVGALDGRIVRISADGAQEDFVTVAEPLGIAARSTGLVVCAKVDRGGTLVPALLEIDSDGSVRTLVETGPEGDFGLTNFVAIAPDDSLVFSDSMGNRIYRADADGANVALVTDMLTYPNGLAFSVDGTTLYAASWDGAAVYALSFDRSSGAYGAPAIAVPDVQNVDGIVVAESGVLYLITSSRGVLRVELGSAPTQLLAPRTLTLPANAVFAHDAFGADTLVLSSLGNTSVHRLLTADVGARLPIR